MTKHLIISLLCFLSGLSLNTLAQQDAQYSQYMFNQMVINPAYTGSKEALTIGLSNRAQWIAMPGAPKTVSVFIHGPLKSKKYGLGAYLFQESIGPVKSSGLYADFSYRVNLREGKLAFGLSGGLLGYAMDFSKMNYKDESEAILTGPNGFGNLDFNTGVYYHNQSFYMGLSLTHLNRPSFFVHNDVAAFQLKRHIFFYLGKAWELNENLVFNPSLMIKTLGTGSSSSFDINANFLIKHKLWLGLSARHKYGLVFIAQYLVNDKFKIGYSYDRGFNRIGTFGKATNEIMLSYDFNVYKPKMVSPRYL